MKHTHVLVQLLVGGGGIFLLKSYNTREHSVCGLAKLIWRASEDTKYMARKKGGDTIIWNSYCPRKRPTTPRRQHRGAPPPGGKGIKFYRKRLCTKLHFSYVVLQF